MTNEEIKKAGEVMIAAANGAHIETRSRDGNVWTDLWVQPKWDWAVFDYRIKPTKTLRPWKPEEVPLGAQTRLEEYPAERHMIVGVNSTGVLLAQDNAAYPFQDLFEIREHSIDGGITRKPCGVEVES